MGRVVYQTNYSQIDHPHQVPHQWVTVDHGDATGRAMATAMEQYSNHERQNLVFEAETR
jgi:hypothetical protein